MTTAQTEVKREFENGERVIAGYQKLELVVVDAVLTLKGWRYQLAFPKKDGKPHKTKHHRFFYAADIKKATL
jgi:hypothetical protein